MSIKRIEAVLKRFTKRLHGLHNLSYNARLEALNEYSLESRRVRADLTFCYKMLHEVVDINCQKFFKPVQSSVTRRHQFKLCKFLCPSTFILALFSTVLLTCGMLSQKILLQPHPWQCLKLD